MRATPRLLPSRPPIVHFKREDEVASRLPELAAFTSEVPPDEGLVEERCRDAEHQPVSTPVGNVDNVFNICSIDFFGLPLKSP